MKPIFLILHLFSTLAWAGTPDTPFQQPISTKFQNSPELQGAAFHRLVLHRDEIPYALTDRGVARAFSSNLTLALDRGFRPLIGKKALDLAPAAGAVFYLFEDRFLSNDNAGKPFGALPSGVYHHLAASAGGAVLAASKTAYAFFREGAQVAAGDFPHPLALNVFAWDEQFFAVLADGVYRFRDGRWQRFHEAKNITALEKQGQALLVGTAAGYYAIDARSAFQLLPLQDRLPSLDITCFAPAPAGLWIGTAQGAVFRPFHGPLQYYASRRWLLDDHVLGIQTASSGAAFILTKTGLNKIDFQTMTLEDKAAVYDRKIRERHIRFGFCAELRLSTPGDITSAEMIDTDNDGTWSNYYMASQAFRYAATKDPKARENAWETFAAMERLESINGLDGFPSRSFERLGFKVSDPDRWHPAQDGVWEWKAHTSSDEIAAHTFGCAVLYETVAQSDAEKRRITAFFEKIARHILRHDYYLIDVDGKPTLWGRWNPEYVNSYPRTIVDRRLNSGEILATLQLAFHMTGDTLFRDKAFELIERHGYLDNIKSSMRLIRATQGFVFQGHDMGDEWNHSDDLLSFITYYVLHRFAFTEELSAHFAAATRDHWDIERIEKNPLWNFVLASTGASEYDAEGALWTLREFPLDLITWRIQNSRRRDLTPLPANFRNQQSAELPPPDERRIMRWNGNPFTLDGGDGGGTELAGDEFLLPYWMGRALGFIQAPNRP